MRARIDRNNTIAALNRNLTDRGLVVLEAINQRQNITKNITSTAQKNGGEAITIEANAIHDMMFLDNIIQRCFKYGETTIANRSREPPK